MSARQALEIATRGGAAVLGRDDIGSLAVGKCADLFAINLNRLDYAGALHDPVAAALFVRAANRGLPILWVARSSSIKAKLVNS
jgi:cytosine/adenosine deaminase-related metal-dependent hydrolase